MERREVLMVAGAVAAAWPTRKAEVGTRNWEPDDSLRVPRSTVRVAATRGWEEQDDPYRLVRQAVREMRLSARAVALESTTAYAVALRLAEALGGKFADATPITDRLRIIKSPEEVALIRQAIDITEAAIAATFAKLAAGASERE